MPEHILEVKIKDPYKRVNSHQVRVLVEVILRRPEGSSNFSGSKVSSRSSNALDSENSDSIISSVSKVTVWIGNHKEEATCISKQIRLHGNILEISGWEVSKQLSIDDNNNSLLIKAMASSDFETGLSASDTIRIDYSYKDPPPITYKTKSYTRTEPRCRSANINSGIQANLADPLWLLTRQWQTGEFTGENAGSPIAVAVDYSYQHLTKVKLGNKVFNATGPLETSVEQEYLKLDWKTRVQIGQQFERYIKEVLSDKKNAQEIINKLRQHNDFSLPQKHEIEELQLDHATKRFLVYMSGRSVDGQAILEKRNIASQFQTLGLDRASLLQISRKLIAWCSKLNIRLHQAPSPAWRNQPLDYRFEYFGEEPITLPTKKEDAPAAKLPNTGIPSAKLPHTKTKPIFSHDPPTIELPQKDKPTIDLPEIDRPTVDLPEVDRPTVDLPEVDKPEFRPPKTQIGPHLIAPHYRNGALDWYTFDAKGELKISNDIASKRLETYPTRLSIAGTSLRWWEFEDGSINFGQMNVETNELAKLVLLEFALIFGDDWYSMHLEAPHSSILGIRNILVTNVFGKETKLQPAVTKGNLPTNSWEIFTMAQYQGAKEPATNGIEAFPARPQPILPRDTKEPDSIIFLPPTLMFKEESKPIEQIVFKRDELANIVWAEEEHVRNGIGQGTKGIDLQRELTSPPPNTSENDQDTLRYQLANTVADNWIPFVPFDARHHFNTEKVTKRLRRAQMLRSLEDKDPSRIEAMTQLLELGDAEGDPLLWLEEYTIPRSGLRFQLTAQRVRWVDGKTYVWYGRKVLAGSGEGRSGLRFDVIEH